MSRTQRTFTVALWCLVVVSLLTLVAMQRWQIERERSARSTAAAASTQEAGVAFDLRDGELVPATTEPSAPFTFDAPKFKLTDQDGKPFDSAALKGKVWTISFFFSQCQGVCPTMLGRIESLQKVTTDPDVHFVYFTVDPARDTPEKLHAYAAEAKAQASRWHLLTGDEEEMHRIAAACHLPYATPAMHSGKVLLVDQQGVVRNYYESRDDAAMLRLAADVKKLAAGEPIP